MLLGKIKSMYSEKMQYGFEYFPPGWIHRCRAHGYEDKCLNSIALYSPNDAFMQQSINTLNDELSETAEKGVASAADESTFNLQKPSSCRTGVQIIPLTYWFRASNIQHLLIQLGKYTGCLILSACQPRYTGILSCPVAWSQECLN